MMGGRSVRLPKIRHLAIPLEGRVLIRDLLTTREKRIRKTPTNARYARDGRSTKQACRERLDASPQDTHYEAQNEIVYRKRAGITKTVPNRGVGE
jgi:hypothetical protein